MLSTSFRKYWWVFALILIFIFSYYIRAINIVPDRILSFDPVFQYRFTKYFVDYGRIPLWDEISYYTGRLTLKEDYPPFMWYITGWLYLLFGQMTMSLLTFVSYMSAFYGALIVIPAFLFVRELSNNHGGLLGAALMGTAPQILIRTFGSSYDNDQLVLFFTLLTLYLGVYALKKRSFASFSLLLTGFVGFMLTWGFYFYSYVILVAILAIHLILTLVWEKQSRLKALYGFKKQIFIFIGIFIALLLFGMAVGTDVPKAFFDLLGFAGSAEQWIVNVSIAELQPIGELWLSILAIISASAIISYLVYRNLTKRASEKDILFPVVFVVSSIALLIAVSIEYAKNGSQTSFISYAMNYISTITLTIGRFFIGIPVVDLILLVLSFSFITFSILSSFKRDDLFKFSAVLSLFIISLYSSFRGIRFTEFTSALFILLIGIGFGNLIEVANKKSTFVKIFSNGTGMMIILFAFLIGSQIALSLGPDVSPNWDDAWNFLKTQTSEFSIVGTWWDPGHMISGIADRRNFADGGHCHTCLYTINDRIVDLGKIMATTSENESLRLIRKYQGDSPKVYWIASDDLIGKYQWLQYFGESCDARIDSRCPLYIQLGEDSQSRMYDNNGNLVILSYPLGSQGKILIYNSPSMPIPIYIEGINAALFGETIYYNETKPVVVKFNQNETDSLITTLKPLESQLNVRFTNQTIPMTVWMPNYFSYITIIPPNLRNTVFTRMFMLEGQDLEHFKLVFNNPQVKIYEVI